MTLVQALRVLAGLVLLLAAQAAAQSIPTTPNTVYYGGENVGGIVYTTEPVSPIKNCHAWSVNAGALGGYYTAIPDGLFCCTKRGQLLNDTVCMPPVCGPATLLTTDFIGDNSTQYCYLNCYSTGFTENNPAPNIAPQYNLTANGTTYNQALPWVGGAYAVTQFAYVNYNGQPLNSRRSVYARSSNVSSIREINPNRPHSLRNAYVLTTNSRLDGGWAVVGPKDVTYVCTVAGYTPTAGYYLDDPSAGYCITALGCVSSEQTDFFYFDDAVGECFAYCYLATLDVSQSCLNSTTDPLNCGTCGNDCYMTELNVNETDIFCSGGVCNFTMCDPGFANCDLNPENGCETYLINSNNTLYCGSCENNCNATILNVVTVICDDGVCGYDECKPGYADCDQNPLNGCEVDLLTSSSNCGACNVTCSPAQFIHVNVTVCMFGMCNYTNCSSGYGDCDRNCTNGCETNLNFDATNCGSCGNNCFKDEQNVHMAECTYGKCTYDYCLPIDASTSFNDCDGNTANGCESNPLYDNNNCGSCGNVCHSPLSCSNGVCE